MRYKKQREFLSIEQGDRSVEDYEREFTRLSRFAPLMVSTEELKVECFVMGLRPDVRGAVLAHVPPDYATTLRLAKTLDIKEYPTEDTQTHLNTSVDQKRKREKTSPTSSKLSWHQAKTNLNQERKLLFSDNRPEKSFLFGERKSSSGGCWKKNKMLKITKRENG